jgi:hypothetical protein
MRRRPQRRRYKYVRFYRDALTHRVRKMVSALAEGRRKDNRTGDATGLSKSSAREGDGDRLHRVAVYLPLGALHRPPDAQRLTELVPAV